MRTAFLLLAVTATAAAQVAPDPKLRFRRDTYHPVVEELKAERTAVTNEQLEQIKRFPVETVWAVLQGLGYKNCYWSGFQSTRPQERLAGRALTIRYLPRRPDLDAAMQKLAAGGDWPTAYNVRAAEEARPGDVLVVDLGGSVTDGVFFGDISATGARTAGARGAILFGSTRDLSELRGMAGFPVLAAGFDPKGATQIGVDWNVPVRVGSATVLPGDVVLADEEAVVFFPPQLAQKVIEGAASIDEQERFERELAGQGKHRFRDVYPLSPELRKKLDERKR